MEGFIKKEKKKKRKKKMKSVKKAMWFILIWALIIQLYVMFMIARLGDTMSLAILAGTVFTEAFAAFLAYLSYKTKINLKNMEMNFIPDYDDKNNLY